MANPPEVKIIAISNVFCRSMHFKEKGDVELGHCHTYDHGTLVSTGKLLVEMLRDDDTVISQKEFTGPSFIFISKLCRHRLTALEDDTVAVCIHALKDIEGNLLSPDFFVEEKWFADKWKDSPNFEDHLDLYMEVKRNTKIEGLVVHDKKYRDFLFFNEITKNK